jgi:Na+/H+ antiporter NhaD/arsenite permease-like protein
MSDALSLTTIAGMGRSSRRVMAGIGLVVICYFAIWAFGLLPDVHHAETVTETADSHTVTEHVEAGYVPPAWAVLPFVFLLLAIAVLPLIPFTEHWWHYNRNRFLVAVLMAGVALAYYAWVHPGGVENHLTHQTGIPPGIATVGTVFSNAILNEYIPFIVLLFSLYVISGGISLRGDLPAHPLVNCVFLGVGTLLASFIGTTGAAMVLIRPLLATNAERKYKVHTVIFFIFMVCNCGGLLLPIGDPPLFLGYLRGVPFTWTLQLWPYWLGVNLALLVIYYIWDRIVYSREPIRSITRDEAEIQPLRLSGRINFILILGVVLSVAFIVPGKHLFGTGFLIPHFFREIVMLLLVVLSLRVTRAQSRVWNRFDYHAIIEVAALFFGIFICMQVPIEILHAEGKNLGINSPVSFFWATGLLSSFLDNAPTYVVFFETAAALPLTGTGPVVELVGNRAILESFLVPISLGAVFMGANTYIGNGPNFMVKSIAEQSGIKMPSFFGYMLYSLLILVPCFVGLTFLL